MKSSDRRREARVWTKEIVQISSKNPKWQHRVMVVEMETLSSGGVSIVCPQLLDAELDHLLIRIPCLDGSLIEAEVENVWQRIDPQCVAHRYGFAFMNMDDQRQSNVEAFMARRLAENAAVPSRRLFDRRATVEAGSSEKRRSDRRGIPPVSEPAHS